MIKTQWSVQVNIVFLMILVSKTIIYGLGISTEFNNIFIENLQIGQEYNLTKDFNLPFKANYTGDTKAIIKLESVEPSNLKSGFEVIPDVSWVKFSETEILSLPQETIFSDVKIKIPYDKTLIGRKFQVNIRCYVSSVDDAGLLTVTPGVEGSFLFSIAEEIKKKKVKPVDLNFELEPKEIFQTINVRDNFVGRVNIKNRSKKKYVFVIKYRTPQEVNVKPKEGYKLLSEKMLSFPLKELVIKSGKEGVFDIYIDANEKIVPDKYFGLVEVQVSTKEVVWNRYIKLYLEVID